MFVPTHFVIREARADWEISGCFALRRAVFCDEQRIFAGDDRDERDGYATMLAAIGTANGVIGTVRIHQDSPGEWSGSRLAVRKDLRRIVGLGTGLIRVAVGTAQAIGCSQFTAHVQAANVPLFESLHWHSLSQVELHGRPHHLMRADLAYYPAQGAA